MTNTSIAVMAAAIMAGLMDQHPDDNKAHAHDFLRSKCSAINGSEDLYELLAPSAVAIAAFGEEPAVQGSCKVFAYEVAEVFGAWAYNCIVLYGGLPSQEVVAAKIVALIDEFLKK